MNIKVLIFSIVFTYSAAAMSNVGFRCKDLKVEISREKYNDILTLVVKNTETGELRYSSNLVLPETDTVDAYQERFGYYYELMANAQSLFPYMPEGVMVIHIMRSTNLYKKGIQAFEANGKWVELPKMYCKAYIEAITKY